MWRVLEIAGNQRFLALETGNVVIRSDGEELGRVPICDLAAVLVHGYGNSYSNDLLVRLAAEGVPLVLCDRKFQPAAWLWPVAGNRAQGERFRRQFEARKPLKKRLWQAVVRAKLGNQAALLEARGAPWQDIAAWAKGVGSGDPKNLEARGARAYWPRLLGEQFRRDRNMGGANTLLNYGYVVLRSLACRQLVAAGLHPSIAIFHSAKINTMALADDIMEPFRPMVDARVAALVDEGHEQLDGEVKAELAALPNCLVELDGKDWGLNHAMGRVAQSLARSFEEDKVLLLMPSMARGAE